jgi:A nuclease family of the HNH/ENDO VII superfamily with conserved AHH
MGNYRVQGGQRVVSNAQAHHIIPWQSRNHPVVQAAARGGFNINNGAHNGVNMTQRTGGQHHTNINHRGNHARYNAAMNGILDNIQRQNPNATPQQYAQILLQVTAQMRNNIQNSTSTRRIR